MQFEYGDHVVTKYLGADRIHEVLEEQDEVWRFTCNACFRVVDVGLIYSLIVSAGSEEAAKPIHQWCYGTRDQDDGEMLCGECSAAVYGRRQEA